MSPASSEFKQRLVLVSLLLVVLAVGVIGYWMPRPRPGLVIDRDSPFTDRCLVSRPDILIRTKSLSSLPDDLKQIPFMREFFESTVWEDIQHSEARLSFAGTLYRIAFEHDLKLEDDILRYLLDTPAEVALWGGYDGTIRDALVIIPSSVSKDTLLKLSRLAGEDSQLKPVDLVLSNDETLIGVTIDYAAKRSLTLAHGNGYFYAATNPRCVLPVDPPESAPKQDWLGYPKDVSLLSQAFDLPADNTAQEMVFSFRYLSGGYSALMPWLDAVRVVMDKQGWRAEALYAKDPPSAVAGVELWQMMPMNAAACVKLPIDKTAVWDLIAGLEYVDAAVMKRIQDNVSAIKEAPVAACWRDDQPYLAPVFITPHSGEFSMPEIQAIFEKVIGSDETQDKNTIPSLPVTVEERGATRILTREISSPVGWHAASESDQSGKLRHDMFMRVALAVTPQYLIFSPEKDNVLAVLAVASHTAPSLAENLPAAFRDPDFILEPARFKTLLTTTMTSLVAEGYRAAVWARFMPTVEILGGKRNIVFKIADKPAVDDKGTKRVGGGIKAVEVAEW